MGDSVRCSCVYPLAPLSHPTHTHTAQASETFPHLQEHAEFLRSRRSGLDRWAYLLSGILTPHTNGPAALGELDDHTALGKEQFKALLGKIDAGLRALPPTAQVRAGGAMLVNPQA